jgi:ethanolamine ammonia-lyase small subunit
MDPPPALQPQPEDPGSDQTPQATILTRIRSRTPARILSGRAGSSYRTSTYLELRADHAAARDAVTTELDLDADLGAAFVAEWALFEVPTLARTKAQYLLRPELGRSLEPSASAAIAVNCPSGVDLQVAIADGLSAAAVRAQAPALLPVIAAEAARRGWRFGRPFVVRHGRVGVLNAIGELLDPAVVVLLIGERPGLATAESLSAYMAYRPRAAHDDARRNLVSNIHSRGVSPDEAAARIARLAEQMIRLSASGVAVKEEGAPATVRSIEPPSTGLGR